MPEEWRKRSVHPAPGCEMSCTMVSVKCRKRFALPAILALLSGAAIYLLFAVPAAMGYSVLSHEALIDAAWGPYIVPLLLKRYPHATPAEIREAHAFAYGGCVIQDMGYYPFGNKFFSELTHYARSGDFVEALLRDSRNIDEYAFALGALSHYVADNTGHPLAVNVSVPVMYPTLQMEFGNHVSYEEDPTAHIMTEFSFDVVQITGAGYLPKTYHNYIGFKVPETLLAEAFQQTYGLKLNKLFYSEHISLWMYKISASEIVPDLGQVIWRHKKKEIRRVNPRIVTARFSYRLSRENFESARGKSGRFHRLRPWRWRWRADLKRENSRFVSRTLVFFIEVMPKVGPFHKLQFKPPTGRVQSSFIRAFDVTVSRYENDMSALSKGGLRLNDENLDIGQPSPAGEYFLADETYAHLLHALAKHRFRNLTPELRANILAFYSNLDGPIVTKQYPHKWKRTLRELSALRSAPVETRVASQ